MHFTGKMKTHKTKCKNWVYKNAVMYNTQTIHLDLFENELNAFFPLDPRVHIFFFTEKVKVRTNCFKKKYLTGFRSEYMKCLHT